MADTAAEHGGIGALLRREGFVLVASDEVAA